MNNSNISEIAKALYIINRHAKNAPKLYEIKNYVISLLLKEGYAKKIGLNLYKNSRQSNQSLFVLVKVNDFLFHYPPKKEDIQNLVILQHNKTYRNPKIKMSIKHAKSIINLHFNYIEKPKINNYNGFSSYLNAKKIL